MTNASYDFDRPPVTKVISMVGNDGKHFELTGDGVHMARILSFWSALSLWVKTGMQMSRHSAPILKLTKQEFGLTGNKHKVLEGLENFIEIDLLHPLGGSRVSERAVNHDEVVQLLRDQYKAETGLDYPWPEAMSS
jgi:hypothetical protein